MGVKVNSMKYRVCGKMKFMNNMNIQYVLVSQITTTCFPKDLLLSSLRERKPER